MPLELVIILIIFALGFTVFAWSYVIKRRLVIKYALLWLLFCVAMTVAVLIPDVLRIVCDYIGIETVSNFIFFLGFGLLLFITFGLTSVISMQKAKITALAQEVAILKNKVGK